MTRLYRVPAAAGRLAGIACKPVRGAALVELSSTTLSRAGGVAGDARGRPGRRQVTVLDAAGWAAALADLGRQYGAQAGVQAGVQTGAQAGEYPAVDLPWTARRANLLVTGLDLAGQVGLELCIGATARLRITGETDPCGRMEALAPGLRAALSPGWRGGVTARVINDGPIAVGDPVILRPVAAGAD